MKEIYDAFIWYISTHKIATATIGGMIYVIFSAKKYFKKLPPKDELTIQNEKIVEDSNKGAFKSALLTIVIIFIFLLIVGNIRTFLSK
jgi:hypothetical protein